MKFIFTNILALLTSVGFGIYLLNTDTFLPYDSLGNLNNINIFIFTLLIFIIALSFISLILTLILSLIKKDWEKRYIYFVAFKYALIVTLGLLSVGILNHFHVLNWVWGLSVFGVVLIGLIII